MLPVANIKGKMKVASMEGASNVTWSWEFDVSEENESVAKESLSQVGKMGLEGIETLVLQN